LIDSCYLGDVRDGLRAITAAGIRPRTCVTSPPYWGLRDYGVAGQIGLEPTPDEYVANMVAVFRLVRDALADDGTCWLNLGDSYATGGGVVGECPGGGKQGESWKMRGKMTPPNRMPLPGLKPKDLIGVPWRVALALQADGWWLRSDIIWHKPNPMPESVTDRPTKAHEYLFLLSKRGRYYWNAEAMRENVTGGAHARKSSYKTPDGWDTRTGRGGHGSFHSLGREKGGKVAPAGCGIKNNASIDAALGHLVGFRNRRSVWTIPSEPFHEAHFATFPAALVEPCILAGSESGDVVLDPFMGSGTVAQVAQALGRRWVGCELNPAYHAMIRARIAQTGMVF
jgi:site-specific DNA-methyltransferase (cytosine-N4-specific)